MATELGLPYYETSAATGEGEQINIYCCQAIISQAQALLANFVSINTT